MSGETPSSLGGARQIGAAQLTPVSGVYWVSERRKSEMSGRGQAIIPSVVAALWSYVVLDFAIHAVVLAAWWRDTGAFSLSPIEMAKRIPVGYASSRSTVWGYACS